MLVASQPQFNPKIGIVASAEAIPWHLRLGCSDSLVDDSLGLCMKLGDTGRYQLPDFIGPRKRYRKVNCKSRIICAKLPLFYLCEGYDWEIRIRIWWVCLEMENQRKRIMIEPWKWRTSPLNIAIFTTSCLGVRPPKVLLFVPLQSMWLFPQQIWGVP